MAGKTPHLHPQALLSRREATRRVGGWVIFLGALGTTAALGDACAPEPGIDLPNGIGGSPTGSPTPTGTGITSPTPTPSGTPVDACGCNATASGTNTGLTRSSIPANGVAYNSSASMFLCHDSSGFYCLSSICTHAGCDMGTTGGGFTATNLGAGFYCGCHGSQFDASGTVTHGPAFSALQHFQVAFDGSGNLWVDSSKSVSSTCRCT